MLNYIFSRIGITNLKAYTGNRNNLSGFIIFLDDFDFCLYSGVVNQVTVDFTVLIYVYSKSRYKLFSFKPFNLLYDIYAVRKIIGSLGKAVLVGYKQCSFSLSCIIVRACTLKINLKYCVFFGVFNLC